MNGQNPRQIAVRVLGQRKAGGEFTENLLDRALNSSSSSFSSSSSKIKSRTRTKDEEKDEKRLSSADRGLCQEIVYGVVRWQAALDWLIARKTGGREQKPGLQNLLRLGLYQIFWLDRIPDHAAVNETVELAKRGGFGQQAGFINAILRGYLRETDATRKLLADLKVTDPATGCSHPEWLVARWRKHFGAEKTAQLLDWNNTPPKTFARVNTLKFSGTGVSPVSFSATNLLAPMKHTGETPVPLPSNAGDLLTRWREENVEYDFVRRDWLEENLVFELKSHPSLNSLASFRDGWFYVQDPGTLLAVTELNPQPGETILDLCAAPGGKTTFIAQLMRNEGKITACDISDDRLKLIRENCQRLGVTCAEATLNLAPPAPHPGPLPAGEGELSSAGRRNRRNSNFTNPGIAVPSPGGEGQGEGGRFFDRILVDAPCSNTGVLRRRVDLRWRISAAEISRLHQTQLDLLKLAATKLKSRSVLIYSTCSLEPEENSEVVKEFLREHAGFKLENERELLPFADSVDGAYVARLKHST
jgi:16S rRNA (cytosine967-C5)-methyltransferase